MRTFRSFGKMTLGIALACGVALGRPTWAATEPAPEPADEESIASDLVPESEDDLGTDPYDWIRNDEACNEDICAACCVGPGGRHWFRADYLLWWTRGSRVVPLVTTGDSGVIDVRGTEILFGGTRIDQGDRSNVRLSGGFWLDCGRIAGVEFDYFSLGEGDTDFSYYSSGQSDSAVLGRPFYKINTDEFGPPGESAELVGYFPYLEGTVDGRIKEYFHSAGVDFRLNVCCHQACCCQEACCAETCCDEDCGYACCGGERSRASVLAANLCAATRRHCTPRSYRVDLIAGYRTYRLNDGLQIREDVDVLEAWPEKELTAGTTFDIEDSFRTRNEFHGGELGFIAQFYRGCWSLDLLAKIGIGNNNQIVSIAGNTVITRPLPDDGTDVKTYDAGILALDTNTGRYVRNDFVVIPQIGAEIGYQICCGLRAHVGYTFLYWSDVVRAAEQIDYTVNTSYIPPPDPSGAERPAFQFVESDFWAHGLNAGLEWRF